MTHDLLFFVDVRNWLTALLVSFVIGLTAGPAAAARECPEGLEPVGEFRLFFGLADATGKVVTEEEWQRFLEHDIICLNHFWDSQEGANRDSRWMLGKEASIHGETLFC